MYNKQDDGKNGPKNPITIFWAQEVELALQH